MSSTKMKLLAAAACFLALCGCKTFTVNTAYFPPPVSAQQAGVVSPHFVEQNASAHSVQQVDDFEVVKAIMLQNFSSVGGEFAGVQVQPVKSFVPLSPVPRPTPPTRTLGMPYAGTPAPYTVQPQQITTPSPVPGMGQSYQPSTGTYGYITPAYPYQAQQQTPPVQSYSYPYAVQSYPSPYHYEHGKKRRFRGAKTLKLAFKRSRVKVEWGDKEASEFPAEDLEFVYSSLGELCRELQQRTPLTCTALGDRVKVSYLYTQAYPVAPLDAYAYITNSIINVLHHPDAQAVLDRGWLTVTDDRIGHQQIQRFLQNLFDMYMTVYHVEVQRTRQIKKPFSSPVVERKTIASVDISPLNSPLQVGNWYLDIQKNGWSVIVRIYNPAAGIQQVKILPAVGGTTSFVIEGRGAYSGFYTVTVKQQGMKTNYYSAAPGSRPFFGTAPQYRAPVLPFYPSAPQQWSYESVR